MRSLRLPHVLDHDLERYHRGMVKEPQLSEMEQHLLWCAECIRRAQEGDPASRGPCAVPRKSDACEATCIAGTAGHRTAFLLCGASRALRVKTSWHTRAYLFSVKSTQKLE